MKKVLVMIPCFNEAASIATVVKGFDVGRLRQQGYELDILVIDNSSTDQTAQVARRAGARVIAETRRGKGNAIRRGFASVPDDVDYVVMLDGDSTYRPSELSRLIEPLASGFCDAVIGSRLGGKITAGSMASFNRLGNWVYSHLVRYAYRINVTDVLTGYFAWTRPCINTLRDQLQSEGFAIEMEMICKMARLGQQVYSVPISYDARAGESSLHPVRDGAQIMAMFLRTLTWRPRSLRIAFVSDAVYPFHNGGKEKRLAEITKRLAKTGAVIDIYTMKWWDGPANIQLDGVNLIAISKQRPLYAGNRRSIGQALWFGLASLKLVWRRFDYVDVDQMPFFPVISMRLVCWVRRRSLHASWHEVWGREYWQQYAGWAGRLGYAVEWLSLHLPDVIIANSDHTAVRLQAAGVRGEIRVVPLGVDLAGIYAAPGGPTKIDILYSGRLLNHKQVDVLIKAVAMVKVTHPNIRATIVGNGPEKARLIRLIKSLKLGQNVKLIDFIAGEDGLYRFMKTSRMLVLPSVREGFGLVVAEATACGIPVITTNHPDNAARELVIDGYTGYLYDQKPEELAFKIRMVLNHRQQLHLYNAGVAGTKIRDWDQVARSFGEMVGLEA